MTMKISTALATSMLQAASAAISAGAGPPRIGVYSGTQPASADEPVSSQIELVSFLLVAPVFGVPIEVDSGVQIEANPIDSANAAASGTASWFRVYDGDENAHLQGSVSLEGQGGDMIVGATVVVSGAPVTVSSLTVRQRTS